MTTRKVLHFMLFHTLIAQAGDTAGGASTLSVGGIAAGVTAALGILQRLLHTSNRKRLDRIERDVNNTNADVSGMQSDIRWLTLWLTGNSRPRPLKEKPES